MDDRAPLRLRTLRGPRAQAQAQHRDGRRGIRGAWRRLPAPETRPARRFGVWLGELHDDAERLARAQERFFPFRVGVVVADDRIAVRPRPVAHLAEIGHRERHVMDPRPALGEESMHRAERRCAAELALKDRLGVDQTRHREGDVVEADRAQ